MLQILTLNNIAEEGLDRFPRNHYRLGPDLPEPDAVLLRSHDLHAMPLPDKLLAVARAGAGTNNIPVEALSRRGVPVFNTPGANANAVKELVLAGLLMAARNLPGAIEHVRSLRAEGEELARLVEQSKKQWVGHELPGRTLGVVGLGAVGVEVANAAHALGMRVLGFDPALSVQRAWQLSSGVEQARSLEELVSRADVVTLHIPLNDKTRGLVDEALLARSPEGGTLLNFARGAIVEEAAVLKALDQGRLDAYVCDFPTPPLIAHPKVLALPHLGASTREAQVNCAVMAADALRDYLEHGLIRNSVNFPEADLPRMDAHRLAIANANVPNMVGQVSTILGEAGLNIEDLLNRSRGDLAYTLLDLDAAPAPDTLDRLLAVEGVLVVRDLGRPA